MCRLYPADVEVNRRTEKHEEEAEEETPGFYCEICKKIASGIKSEHQATIAHQVAKESDYDSVDFFPVDHTSKGYLIMKAQGYKIGEGLGKNDNQGIVNPVKLGYKDDKLGLGAKSRAKKRDVDDDPATKTSKKEARKEAEKDRIERAALLNYLKTS